MKIINPLFVLLTCLLSNISYAQKSSLKNMDSNTNEYDSWKETNYKTGEIPQCLSIEQEFDYNMDNFLKITNDGINTAAVVKLIKIDNPNKKEITYRIAYIKPGSTYSMQNIPGGKYYLKIAYGMEWKETTINGNCIGRFTKNPQYEKGGDIVDFYTIKTKSGTEIPNYQLTLDVEHNKEFNEEWYYHDFGIQYDAKLELE